MIGFPHKKWNPGVNFDWHNGVFMTPAGIPDPAVTAGMHIGALVLAAPWRYMGSNNNNGDHVLADGMPVVSRGHEVKYSVVPHINVLPPPPSHINILGTLLILGSSSKCQLAACKVKCMDGPLAISGLMYVGVNTACADPCAMPTSMIVNWGTVNVGFTLGDVIAAAFLTAFEALQTFTEDKLFAKLMGTKLMNKLLRGIFRSVLGAILKAGGQAGHQVREGAREGDCQRRVQSNLWRDLRWAHREGCRTKLLQQGGRSVGDRSARHRERQDSRRDRLLGRWRVGERTLGQRG